MADIIYHSFWKDCGDKVIDFNNDTLKAVLLTSSYTPNADHATYSELTNELATGNGYTSGGVTVTGSTANDDANNKTTFDISDPAWTASGGDIGPCRYCAIYDDTPSSPADPLVYLIDFGEDKTANDGATFTINIDSTNFLMGVS